MILEPRKLNRRAGLDRSNSGTVEPWLVPTRHQKDGSSCFLNIYNHLTAYLQKNPVPEHNHLPTAINCTPNRAENTQNSLQQLRARLTARLETVPSNWADDTYHEEASEGILLLRSSQGGKKKKRP